MMARSQFGEPHGQKRHAEDEVEAGTGISNHFKKLRINHAPLRARVHSPRSDHASPPIGEFMAVDESKDRIYIHDLDAEIAEIEANEPQTIFLPDIDKKVSAIPQRLLQNQSDSSNSQLVLYKVPASISVPEKDDAVRKAIIASRERETLKQAQERLREAEMAAQANGIDCQQHHMVEEATYDNDAMDLS